MPWRWEGDRKTHTETANDTRSEPAGNVGSDTCPIVPSRDEGQHRADSVLAIALVMVGTCVDPLRRSHYTLPQRVYGVYAKYHGRGTMRFAKTWAACLLTLALAACGSDNDDSDPVVPEDVTGDTDETPDVEPGDPSTDPGETDMDTSDEDPADPSDTDVEEDPADPSDTDVDEDTDVQEDTDVDEDADVDEPIDDTPPELPENPFLVITDITSDAFRVSWDPATDEESDVSYLVFVTDGALSSTVAEAEADAILRVETSETEVELEGLEQGSQFVVLVFALDEAGNAARYSPGTLTTLPLAANTFEERALPNLGDAFASGLYSYGSGRTVLVGLSDGRVLRSTDFGANFAEIETGVETSILTMAEGPGAQSVLAVGGAGTLLRSADAGETWDTIETGTEVALFAVEAVGVDTLFVGGSGGLVLRSTDSGETWTELDLGLSGDIVGISADEDGRLTVVTVAGEIVNADGEDLITEGDVPPISAFHALVPFFFFFGGDGPTLVRFAGEDWSPLALPEDYTDVRSIWLANDTYAWVGDFSGRIGMTTDGAENWVTLGQAPAAVTSLLGTGINNVYGLLATNRLIRIFHDPDLEDDENGDN